MENTEILVNNDAIEVAEEIVTKAGSGLGKKIGIATGVVLIIGTAAYAIGKKIKAKKGELVTVDEAEEPIVENEEENIEDEAE